jgi:hypothetical protein
MPDNRIEERQEPMLTLIPVWGILALSLGSGLVVLVGSGLVVLALRGPGRVAVGLAGAAILLVWLGSLGRASWVVWKTERIGPAEVVQAAPMPALSVEVVDVGRGRMAYVDLPGTAEQLGKLAAGVLSGRPFSESEWCGSGASRPYSQRGFRELRAVLLDRGLCCWRNPDVPTLGVVLTAVGRAVFRGIAEQARADACVRQEARFLDAPVAGGEGGSDVR